MEDRRGSAVSKLNSSVRYHTARLKRNCLLFRASLCPLGPTNLERDDFGRVFRVDSRVLITPSPYYNYTL